MSNETKWTPGPWMYIDKRPQCSGFSVFSEVKDGHFVAFVGDSDQENPVEHDARLIAAAPDLLAAAQEALRLLESVAPYHPQPAALRAAIAKAIGSQT